MFTTFQEDTILDGFRSSENDVIVRDGAINRSVFLRQKRRVLIVLKEANDPSGTWAGDYRKPEHRSVFQRASTWPMISKISALLTEGLDFSFPYDEAHNLSQNNRLDLLSRIAVLNLKKKAGGSRCDRKSLFRYLNEDRLKLLKEQIEMYQPHIVLAGGDDVMEVLMKLYTATSRRIYEPDGLHHFCYRDNRIAFPVMVIWHPNATNKTHLWLYEHYCQNLLKLDFASR